MPKYKFCRKKLDRCQNVWNFKLSSFDFINYFDNLHGLAAKCKKPDDKLKKTINFFSQYKIEFD